MESKSTKHRGRPITKSKVKYLVSYELSWAGLTANYQFKTERQTVIIEDDLEGWIMRMKSDPDYALLILCMERIW